MKKLDYPPAIAELIRTAINSPEKDKLKAYLSNPEPYLSEPSGVPSWNILFVSMPLLRKRFWKTLVILHKELVPKYISAEALYEEIWELLKDIVLNKESYQDSIALNNKLSSFYHAIKKTLSLFTVIYHIKYLDVGEKYFQLRNIEVYKLTGDYLQSTRLTHGINQGGSYIFDKWEGRSIAKIEIAAVDTDRAIDTGRKEVEIVLDLLKLIARSAKLSNTFDILFRWEIAEVLVITKQSVKRTSLISRQFGDHHAVTVDMGNSIDNELKDNDFWMTIVEGALPEDIHKRVIKATHWISKAIMMNDIDLDYKLVMLCTALEIMLLPSYKSGNKGELIALRQLLLGRSNYYNPTGILHLYNIRSDVIHEGNVDITSRSDYWNLLICCMQVLKNIVTLSRQYPDIITLNDLIAKVQDQETLDHFIDNCKIGMFEGKDIRDIQKVAQRMRNNP